MAAPIDYTITMKDDNVSWVSELGITVRNDYGKTPTDRLKTYNSKLMIFREMVLATLGVFCKRRREVSYAADVIAASGLCGLQWKKNFGETVHVTISDKDGVDKMEDSLRCNGFSPVVKQLDSTRIPGFPLESQLTNEIRISRCNPNILMHLETFHFLYIDSQKSLTNFVDAAFCNVKNNGIVSFVCSFVSSFSRCPELVQRYHTAFVTKTEFMKELAARISIASIARAAARCNKGIEILFVASFEDFLLITVRAHRGPHLADSCVSQIQRLLYCQICEDKVFLPHKKATVEDPYSLLPCNCQKITPGKTAVELGPLWSGEIFNSSFLSEMLAEGTRLKLSTKFHVLTTSILEEARCGDTQGHVMTAMGEMSSEMPCSEKNKTVISVNSNQSDIDVNESHKECERHATQSQENIELANETEEKIKLKNETEKKTELANETKESIELANETKESIELANETKEKTDLENEIKEQIELEKEIEKTSQNTELPVQTQSSSLHSTSESVMSGEGCSGKNIESRKRVVDDVVESCKKRKIDDQRSSLDSEQISNHNTSSPPFYLNLERKKSFPGVLMPKVQRVVTFLKADGYRASRTHFAATSIRTNATHAQLFSVLKKYCAKK